MRDPVASLSVVNFAEMHHKIPALVISGTRCGKANCTCASTDYRHRTACLYWRDGSHSQRRYVPRDQVDAVRSVIEQRRAERRAWREALADSRAQLRALRTEVRELRDAGTEVGLW